MATSNTHRRSNATSCGNNIFGFAFAITFSIAICFYPAEVAANSPIFYTVEERIAQSDVVGLIEIRAVEEGCIIDYSRNRPVIDVEMKFKWVEILKPNPAGNTDLRRVYVLKTQKAVYNDAIKPGLYTVFLQKTSSGEYVPVVNCRQAIKPADFAKEVRKRIPEDGPQVFRTHAVFEYPERGESDESKNACRIIFYTADHPREETDPKRRRNYTLAGYCDCDELDSESLEEAMDPQQRLFKLFTITGRWLAGSFVIEQIRDEVGSKDLLVKPN